MPSTSSRGVASAMAGHHMLVAEIGAPDLFILPDRRRHVGRDDASVDKNGDAVGEREHRVHIMLDKDEGDFPPQLPEQLHHARRFRDAKSCHRFVERHDYGVVVERVLWLWFALLAVAQF